MLEKINSGKVVVLGLSVIYVLYLGAFLLLYLNLNAWVGTDLNYWIGSTYFTVSLTGGIYGLFFVARHWGGWRSDVGRAVILLSTGLLFWGFGLIIYFYYNLVLRVGVPYPSLADLGFFPAYAFWAVGAASLSKATGAQFSLRKLGGKVALLLVPIIIFAISYYLLVVVARGGYINLQEGGLKLFLDLGYPLWDVVILTLAILVYGLARRYFGGKYRLPIYLILLGFVIEFFGDFSFSYATTVGGYYDGSYPDILFVTAMFTLSIGIALLDSRSVPLSANVTLEGEKSKLVTHIIEEQAGILGPRAWSEAQQVEGLSIDVSRMEAYVTGNLKDVLDKLTSQYELLFGGASVEVCREAIHPFLSGVSLEDVPERLR